jgi:hypothetical protein
VAVLSLFMLPRELRDQIYKYALSPAEHDMDGPIHFREAGLLSTCHQIREEAWPSFWENQSICLEGRRPY